MSGDTRETDTHDLSLGVIHALAMVDVKLLSYVQLRRLYASLVKSKDDVKTEIDRRSSTDNSGETVRIQVPDKSAD